MPDLSGDVDAWARGARSVEASVSPACWAASSLCTSIGARGASSTVGRFIDCESEAGISSATRVELAVDANCGSRSCDSETGSTMTEVGAGTGTGTGLSPCEATGAARRRGKYRNPTRMTVRTIANFDRSGERCRRLCPSEVSASATSADCESRGCATMRERIRRNSCFHRFGPGRWKLPSTIESASRRK